MARILDIINPSEYIKEHDRASEKRRDIETWFKEEEIEIDFGETVGRPDSRITLAKEYITNFLENGWTIKAVMSRHSDGLWESYSKSTNKSSSEKFQREVSHTASHSQSIVIDNGGNDYEGSSSGSAYWSAICRVRFGRRRMMPELVLKDMINTFVDNYNKGIQNEDARYNELVSLYSVLINQNQNDVRAFVSEAFNTKPLLEKIMAGFEKQISKASDSATIITNNVTKDSTEDINREFNAKIAAEKAREISVGIYNSTIWPTVEAGYERQRQAALVKAKSEGSQIAVSAWNSIAQIRGSVGASLVDVAQNISSAIDKRWMDAAQMRNTVMKWMLDFCGSREDIYPQLQEISALAERIGFSVGATGNVL